MSTVTGCVKALEYIGGCEAEAIRGGVLEPASIQNCPVAESLCLSAYIPTQMSACFLLCTSFPLLHYSLQPNQSSMLSLDPGLPSPDSAASWLVFGDEGRGCRTQVGPGPILFLLLSS